jgi:hypothetical protein
MLLWIIILGLFIYLSNVHLAKEGMCSENGKLLRGLCICEKGWKGTECEQKIENVCFDQLDDPERIEQDLKDSDDHILQERDNHNYNNYEIQNIKPWKNVQKTCGTLLDMYKNKKQLECNGNSTCPPSGAMDIEELKAWSKKLKEIREIKRCSTKFCPLETEENPNKKIEVKQDGNKLLKINTKRPEAFSNFSLPIQRNQSPKLHLGPQRTTNMFNII